MVGVCTYDHLPLLMQPLVICFYILLSSVFIFLSEHKFLNLLSGRLTDIHVYRLFLLIMCMRS